MSNIIKSYIDHIGIINLNLDSCRKVFIPLGFAGGPSTKMDTGLSGEKAAENMHFMFDNSYLECIESKEGDYLREYLHSPSAMHTVVMSSADIERTHENALSCGFEITPVMEASRPADHGENKGNAVFQWFKFLEPCIPFTLLGSAEHKTKQYIYQEHRYQHPNTAFQIDRIVVGCKDEAELQTFSEGIFKLNSAVSPFCDPAHLINNIELCTKDEISTLYNIHPDLERSQYNGIVFSVKDMKTVKEFAEQAKFDYAVHNDILIIDFTEQLNLFIGFKA